MKTNNMKKLLRGLVTEEAIPGLDNTVRVTKDSKKHNDEYQKEVSAKMKEYEEGITGEEDDMEHNKVNATDKQKEYHDQMEIKNGMEMLRFAQEPNERFKERAEMAIKGDSKMGNKTYTGEWNPETGEGNGNTEPLWAGSNKDFAKKHIEDTKASQKKRDEMTPEFDQFGDDIEAKKAATKGKTRLAIKEGSENPMADPNYTHFAVQKSSNKILNGWNYSDYEREELQSEKQAYFFEDLDDYISNGMKKSDILITTRKNMEKKGIDPTNSDNWYKVGGAPSAEPELGENNKNIQENKIGMKRLRFKTPFNGVETALKVIPEGYKEDDKVFEMTDGNETYRVRWEGSLTEGEAVVLESENAKLIQEGRDKVMKLMNYNSKDVFGSRKGKDRVEENAKVGDFISKYKGLIAESEKKNKK